MLRVSIIVKQVALTGRLEKYVQARLDKLEKYVPRAARPSAHAEVRLQQSASKSGPPRGSCEITLFLPHATLQVHETTPHVYAAVDVATARLKEQLAGYRAKHGPRSWRERLHRQARRPGVQD